MKWVLPVLLLFFFLVSCSEESVNPEEEPPPTTNDSNLRENVVFIDSFRVDQISNISESSVQFKTLPPGIKPGVALITVPFDEAPSGLMRIVREVLDEGTQNVSVTTSPGSLSDIYKGGTISFTSTLVDTFISGQHTFMLSESGQTSLAYSMGLPCNLSGSVTFGANKATSAELSVAMNGSITLDLDAFVPGVYEENEEMDFIMTAPVRLFSVEGVSVYGRVILYPYLALNGYVEGYTKTVVEDTYSVEMDFSYDGQWSLQKSLQHSFALSGMQYNLSSALTAKAGVNVVLVIGEFAGPTLRMAPYATPEVTYGNDPLWIVEAGVEGGIGLDSKWLLPNLAIQQWGGDIQKNEIARQEGGAGSEPPGIPSYPHPANGTADVGGLPFLRWVSSDPDGDLVTFDVYFGPEQSPPLLVKGYESNNYQLSTIERNQTYYWKIVAKDTTGLSTEGPVWSFTTAPPSDTDIEMVFVQGGSFMMGCVESGGEECYENELPQHEVTLEDYYIGATEVTNTQWVAVMGGNPPSRRKGDDYPVEQISWYKAVEFCNALSIMEGLEPVYEIASRNVDADFSRTGYRLPTEAEWEYAAKGGINRDPYRYAGSDNIADVAWYYYTAGGRTHPVAKRDSNSLSLYDMSGNVREWCWDWYGPYSDGSLKNPSGPAQGDAKVQRGGGLFDQDFRCTNTYRQAENPILQSYMTGVRVVRSAEGTRINQPPVTPSDPVPADGAADVPVETNLSWSSSDPEGGSITYEVYLGEEENPPLLEPYVSDTVYTPYGLLDDVIYFWKIVAIDAQGLRTEGPVWSFRTAPGEPAEFGDLIFVEGGTFIMGCPDGTTGCEEDEAPPHEVTLSSYYIGEREVTQAEFRELLDYNPSAFAGELLPVETVDWVEAAVYCNALSEKEGLTPCYSFNGDEISCDFNANGYRLPTEAEWEYAARGGQLNNGYTYSGSNNANDIAWYSTNSEETTHEVQTKAANELGLYDMSGNVWEWCWDVHDFYTADAVADPTGPESGFVRVIRGGSWSNGRESCRVLNRSLYVPSEKHRTIGFRVVRRD